MLYVISALAAGLTGFSNTARMAAVPGMVQRRQIPAAAAMTQIVFQLGVIVGPALSGLLLGIGLPLVYSLDAAVLRGGRRSPRRCWPRSRRHEGAGSLSPWQSTKEGLRYLRSRQALQGVYLIDINAMVFGMPRALFPAMAGSVFGGGTITLGFLYAAPGVGALIGAVTTGWVANLRRQGWAVIVAVCVWGAAIALFGLVDTLWVALSCWQWRGGPTSSPRSCATRSSRAPSPSGSGAACPPFRWPSCRAGPRLGDMESGAVATLTSIEFSVVSGGLACIVGAAVIGGLMPVFRRHVAGEVDDVPV